MKPVLSRDDILKAISPQVLGDMVDRIGKSSWVVVSKDGRSVVKDPATGYPFKHNNRKFAEMVAKETGGVAVLFSEAIRILTDSSRAQ